ncbi:MAG TPA: outer membrane protein assembly factor BamD [Candidatus Binataceae bacterium]|nr:outer membrane protein assembly factor BamD [Candidatus Binataceae bacterium]
MSHVRTAGPVLLIAAIAAATILGAPGCATQTDVQQLNQNEFTLRGMIASDRQQIDALQAQLRQLRDEVTEVKHGVGAGPNPISDQLASINDRLNKMEADVNALQVGLANAPGTNPAASPGATPAAGPTTAAASGPAELQPTWPQELDAEIAAAANSREAGIKLYRAGLGAMKDGKYKLAEVSFAKLRHTYPKSPLAEPSGYFLANALFEEGKFDDAILQFNDVVMRSPKGRFAAQSLLREAQAFLKLNDRIDARLTLQKLLSDHPETPEVTPANTLLKSLSG